MNRGHINKYWLICRSSIYDQRKKKLSHNINKISVEKSEWIDPGTDIISTIKAQRHGSSLWRTFLIICVGLLFIESYLSRPRTDGLKNIINA